MPDPAHRAATATAQTALRVLIVQPLLEDGPATLGSWLATQGVVPRVVRVELGELPPRSAAGWDAIAMLGGSMSVNDDLPFLHATAALLADAVARGVPVLGHCLGGQMLARVLGAAVVDNPQPEIGWSRITPRPVAAARAWFGEADADGTLPVFQWHGQTFGLPAGAELLAGNPACAHQAFALGPHLGMQFHIEVDAEKLGRWCNEAPPPGDARLAWASVQDGPRMRADTARWLARSQAIAVRIYRRWLALAADARRQRPA